MRALFVAQVEARFAAGFLLSALVSLTFAQLSAQQIPGPNVNMVSGQGWPDGDPFLQRQDEPSVAVSTRNTMHLIAGANDYRTVDLPGLPNGEVAGDAWLGVFKSFDGGATWISTLLPGYPQDSAASPLKAYAAAGDPMVRAGSNGLFYYSGIAFNRTDPSPSAVFVARYIDNNNKEHGDPIAFAGLRIVASNPGASFLDKPALAVDIPRGRATCTIQTPADHGATLTQTVGAGAVYVAYTMGTGNEDAPDFQAQIFFTASPDCGLTWTPPVRVSRPEDRINQGTSIAISPTDGTVHVAWRRFSADGLDDGIVASRSTDFGRKFTTPEHVRKFPKGTKHWVTNPRFKTPVVMSDIAPLDQATIADQFRTNAYPTMTVDGTGRVYVAWAERGFAPLALDPSTGDSRVVIATSRGGGTWTPPVAVDANPDRRGHQLMPALAFAAGKLMLVYYDLRDDVSHQFRSTINDFPGIPLRHTIDLRSVQIAPGAVPVFGPSVLVSQYLRGTPPPPLAPRGNVQLQFNVPNLPLFRRGTVPFLGDYIDLAAVSMVPTARGGWTFNTAASPSPVFHAAWTDNRDVHPPLDGNWQNYTPPNSAYHVVGSSLFDPTAVSPVCQPGQAGMRNQNIYGARITSGLLVAAPGNAKPLSTSLQRAFVVYAQNSTDLTKTFRLTVQNQPVGGRASFSQFPLPPFTRTSPPPLTTVDVEIASRSSISRTLFVTSTDPKAQVTVTVTEITALGGSVVSAGLQGFVTLNPDVANPDVANPDVANPSVANPDVANAEVFTPTISNPDVANPDVANPDVANPDVANPDVANVLVLNPDVANPDVANPDVANPDVANPDVANPDVANPDVANASLTDVSWTISNTGNTTAGFSVKLVLNQTALPANTIVTQLILYRQYKTPVAIACDLRFSTQNVLVANIRNPMFSPPWQRANHRSD